MFIVYTFLPLVHVCMRLICRDLNVAFFVSPQFCGENLSVNARVCRQPCI